MILFFVGSLYVVEMLDQVSGSRLQRVGGIEPRQAGGMDGILFAPVLHGPWEHLLANTVPLLVFGFLLLMAGCGAGWWSRRWCGLSVEWACGSPAAMGPST